MKPTESPSARILVVDDTFSVRDWMNKALTTAGYTVAVARNGKDAMDWVGQARDQNCPFSLMILDLAMPDMTGAALVKEMRERDPDFDTPFVFFTAQRAPTSLAYAHSVQPLEVWDKLTVTGILPQEVARVLAQLEAAAQ